MSRSRVFFPHFGHSAAVGEVNRQRRRTQLCVRIRPAVKLLKRWLLGTHQGGVASTHLQDCLDEFTFRFNRRTSRARGLLFFRLLEQAVDHDPIRYRDLVVNPEIGNQRSRHRTRTRSTPGTLAIPPAD
jgi:hypothetical protein